MGFLDKILNAVKLNDDYDDDDEFFDKIAAFIDENGTVYVKISDNISKTVTVQKRPNHLMMRP